MSQEVQIVVDDRELSSGVLEILQERDGVAVEVRRLALGDYIVDDRLLVERKILADLAVSIKDGRLFSQACRLANAPLRSILVLEGNTQGLDIGGMRREAIQGALITLTVYLGIPLLRSRDLRETVSLMLYAAHQGRAVAAGALARKGRRLRGKRRTQIHILQGLPGVGPDKARRLLDAFGSVEAVFKANQQALTSVDGIGSITAERIHWAIHEPSAAYAIGSRAGPEPRWPACECRETENRS